MLTSVLHTVQMGQSGIKCVQNSAIRPELKQQLKLQLQQYDRMETQAKKLAKCKNWEIKDIHPGVLKMADIMTKAKLFGGERDSKIAGMLIQGNTRGMITGMKNLRQSSKADPQVRALAEKLVEQEKCSIRASEKYL